MKKSNLISTAVIALAIFSGAVSANTDKLAEDIVFGSGTLIASPHKPYVRTDIGQKGWEDSVLLDVHQSESVRFESYVRTESEMDNRDDLISNI